MEALERLASARPDEPLYTFVDERGRPCGELTAREVRERSLRIAKALVTRGGLTPGQRVLVVDRPGTEVVEALLGAMHAGLVPVPLPIPVMGANTGGTSLATFAQDCGASACLTSQAFAKTQSFSRLRAQLETQGMSVPWWVTDELREGEPSAATERPFSPTQSTPALIQYTSGSTRQPRGVCVTYGNLVHQLAYQRQMLRGGPESRYVFWLPHYHDFALVAAIMGAAHGGGRLVLASPTAFLRRPAVWGELMHRYRATHTAAPDFGYRVLVEQTTPEERASWDLSSLEIVSVAAEPIRASTVDRLLTALAPSGLRPSALTPCYGLAEHTVGVTMCGRQRRKFSRAELEHARRASPAAEGEEGVELFGCGTPEGGVEVRIVDPDARRSLAPGVVGEIWVQSPSVCAGYFGREAESRETFRATLADAPGQWLRTGDLGTLLDGELFVTGRLKELVILQGRNLYPQDVEAVAEAAHPLVRTGNVVCFGTDSDAGEQLVLVVELKSQSPSPEALDDVRRAVRAAVQQELGVGAFTLALARRGAVTRTSSGKLQRSACRAAWQKNVLPLIQTETGFVPSSLLAEGRVTP